MRGWQIYALGGHEQRADDAAPEPLPLRALLPAAPRRIGRFIQLALIAALRCRGERALPSDTAVYLCSARGDLETTLEILQDLFRKAQAPKPLQFVNTVSNAASFYVAQVLALQSRSHFTCSRYMAMESALQIAALDLADGRVRSALVGSIDLATWPLAEHRRRVGLAPAAVVGDAAHCLWLGVPDASLPRLGELLAAEHFPDQAALLQWVAAQGLTPERCSLAAGQFLGAEDARTLRAATGLQRPFEYLAGRPYYDSQSGAAIGAFLQAPGTELLLHVQGDALGGRGALLLRR